MTEKETLEGAEDFARMLLNSEGAGAPLKTGQKAKGKVIAVSGDDVFIDIGVKEDGVMDKKELGDAEINVGDEIEGFITSISSQGVKLSRYMNGDNIQALEEARDAEIPAEGKILGARKGGYDVEIMGRTAFCPGSQLGASGTPEELVGQKFSFLIRRVENNGRNIIVSRRALLDRLQKENLDSFMEKTNPGDIVEGTVARVAPFGVFVELAPSVEGLAHVSQLAWSRVENPGDFFSPGDPIKVKFLGKEVDDKGRTRLSLSVKQALED
ncbi:MAG: S1 RNA-binding domain-containing protein, partial [Desulfovibrio sp.]|nr:S1 RNA-binding domain-containing protein [Desulfovibrio sp.]